MKTRNSIINKKEDIEYFKSIVKGNTTNEIIDLFYKKTNILLNKAQVKSQKRRFKLTSGLDTKFKKGKGVTGNPFKKGNIPHNKKDNLYEFVSTDGYVYIKVNNKFIQKQRYIYEKEYGKIPKDCTIIFLDGNRQNCEINNLKLIKRKEELIMCSKNLFSPDKEVTKTGILIAQIVEKINELNNEI